MTVSLTRKRLRARAVGDGAPETLPSRPPRRCSDIPPPGGEEICTTPSLTPWRPADASGAEQDCGRRHSMVNVGVPSKSHHQIAETTSTGMLCGVTTWTPECQERGAPDSAPWTCMTTWQARRM